MRRVVILFSVLLAFSTSAYAGSFDSGSTGADGAFAPISNTVVQLPPNGIFNFTSVNIPVGVTVTFQQNVANTPVYILATNDVTISGTLNVNGGNGLADIYPGIGGPGGYNGGMGGLQNLSGTFAPGPGGGAGGVGGQSDGSGGSNIANQNIIPLIGGGGGGGGGYCNYSGTLNGGGGGGGAGGILIASSGTVTITGSLLANGGNGGNTCSGGGGGAGGSIKILANSIAGNGTIQATGGTGNHNSYQNGGNGVIKLEFNTIIRTVGTNPAYTFSSPPGLVFYQNVPILNITSIGGAAVPSNPGGLYNALDVTLPAGTTNPVTVGLSATNVPTGTVIAVKVVPQFSTSQTSVNSTPLSGTLQSSTATASVNISTTYSNVIFATATFAIQTSMYYNGEKIDKVMVAAEMGKGPKVTYITESGKKVPAEKLMASLGIPYTQ